MSMHLGRSWPGMGNPLEQACPCEKAACGLAIPSADCPEHALSAAKSMRQGHSDDRCPALEGGEATS